MWWDISAELRAEFEDWHSHEHFPERLGIPGFLRASRWADHAGGDGFFVMYELDAYATLTSPHYLARLNDPTPWSTKMMPHHRNMVRSLCHIEESFGGGVALSLTTIRLSPAPSAASGLRDRLRGRLSTLVHLPAITGAHLLRTDTPAHATTREQAIRGGADAFADWIVLISGYDARGLAGVVHDRLSAASLAADGAEPGAVASFYDLRHAVTRADF
jgi:hypothetical protein